MKPESHGHHSEPVDNLDWVRQAHATEEILAGLDQRARKRATRRWITGSVLVVALICVTAWQGLPTALFRADPPAPAINSLTVIQPRTTVLPDGSVVELKDGARIAVDYNGVLRKVELLQGTAHFAVARNPARPFVVAARGVGVHAVGTAFAVTTHAQAVEVVVTEGKVAVEAKAADSPPHHEPSVLGTLTAGHRSVVQPDGVTAPIEALDEQAMRIALSWRIPRLDFSRAPLSQVVAEMNKHNRTQVVLADDAIGRFQISGVLQADRLDGLIEMLAADFGLLADRGTERIVLRRGK